MAERSHNPISLSRVINDMKTANLFTNNAASRPPIMHETPE